MKKFKNKILSALLFAFLIVPCMLVVTACGEEHKAGDKWSSDATYHWHACVEKDCKEILDKAEHTFKSDVCSVCGYVKENPTIQAYIGEGANRKGYDTIADAITSAKENDTIVLTKDVNLVNGNLTFTKKLTLDLNGKTLTGNGCNGVLRVNVGGNLTVTGNGKVVAVAGTETEVGAKEGTVCAMAVWAYGGEVTIENGTFVNKTVEGQKIGQGNSERDTQTPDNLDLIYVKDFVAEDTAKTRTKAKIVINGGTFECVQKMWTLNIQNASQGTLKVTGGTFIGFNPGTTDNGDAVNSETEGAKTKETFVKEGYESVQIDSTGNYKVVKKAETK